VLANPVSTRLWLEAAQYQKVLMLLDTGLRFQDVDFAGTWLEVPASLIVCTSAIIVLCIRTLRDGNYILQCCNAEVL